MADERFFFEAFNLNRSWVGTAGKEGEGIFTDAEIAGQVATLLLYGALHYTLHYSTLQYNTVHYSTLQYTAVHYST